MSKKKKLGPILITERGFQLIKFTDLYDKSCSLQQSSLADYMTPGTSALWLGAGEDRMHLDLAQVKLLIVQLQHWVDHGKFSK